MFVTLSELTWEVLGAHLDGGDGSRLNNPATNQAQNQDYKVHHPKTHLIYEPPEHVKGPNLQIQTYRTP